MRACVILRFLGLFLGPFLGGAGISSAQEVDLVLTGGTILDGGGGEAYVGDLGLAGDRLAFVSPAGSRPLPAGVESLDVSGLVVAPGFVNVLSHAPSALLQDGRSIGNVAQGVTLEIFGEGASLGPVNEADRRVVDREGGPRWNTLGEALEFMVERGVSCNIASNVGATQVRRLVIGEEDRAPEPDELARMCALVREAMEEGAVGLSTALIYAPGHYAGTEELIALSEVVAEFDGLYTSHMRSEGNTLLEGVEELLRISREAGVRAEIYHLKAMGRANWPKMERVFEVIEAARAEERPITANMYTYVAGATSLAASIPPWAHEGGFASLRRRLQDPGDRARILADMRAVSNEWENLQQMSSKVLLAVQGPINGRTLTEVAEERGLSREDAVVELVLECNPGAIYFLMSEENVVAQMRRPWVSFGSDGTSMSPDNATALTHPRSYGNFARLLGRYVRDQGVLTLAEAIRRLSALPCENFRVRERGRLQPGLFADVVVFDPAAVQDHASFADPHQVSSGVRHVLVNGEFVWRDGEHTGALPGRVVRGPGWIGHASSGGDR